MRVTIFAAMCLSQVLGCTDLDGDEPERDETQEVPTDQMSLAEASDRQNGTAPLESMDPEPHDVATICDVLGTDMCTGDERCQPIMGVRYELERDCKYEEHVIGCRSKSAVCPYYRVTGVDTVGQTWIVDGDCVPSGWRETHHSFEIESWPTCSGELTKACTQHSVEECALEPHCVTLKAVPVDLERMCVGSLVAVGCMRGDVAAGAALTLARDPEGQIWQFASTALPSGWTEYPLRINGGDHYSLPPEWTAACP